MVIKENKREICLSVIARAFDGLSNKNFSETALITIGIKIYKYYFPNAFLDDAIKDTISIMRQQRIRGRLVR